MQSVDCRAVWVLNLLFGKTDVGKLVVLFLVKEVSVPHVVVRVVTGHWLWSNLGVGVSEVDISHVIGIVQQIWIHSVVEPSVMRIVLAVPMSLGHHPCGSG